MQKNGIVKDVWVVDVVRQSSLKVVFSEPVTKEEAMRMTVEGDYEDVMDEEDYGMEAVGAK